ncbi:PQQ-binding-like beta-propeller repeat protein, partial [Deinococcus sonorensis]
MLGLVTLALAVPPPQGGQSGTSQAGSPSYTSAQSTSGQQVYTAHCQSCHGGALQGGAGPALAGTSFTNKWATGSHTLQDLYDVIAHQMPLTAPGSLSQKQYQDVTAFVLSKNGYTAGKAPLTPQTLKVKLTAPKAAGQASGNGAGASSPAVPVPANLPQVVKSGGTASGTAPTDQELLNPQDGDWLAYNRDFRGQRFSPLKSITADNAAQLQVKCVFQLGEVGSFQTGPVVYQGLMYITSVHNTYALKANTCTKVWESDYTPKGPEPQPANRGVALYDGMVFRGTGDGHLLGLDAKTGKVLWDTWVADSNKGYFLSAAPIAADGKVYIGEAGADWGANGHVRAFDAKTGNKVWEFGVIPTGKQPGAETWQKGAEHGGGSIWTTLTLDPANKQLYVSVGNPAPDFNGGLRPGDNLYTDSVVALDANTGKLGWYVQQVAHDTHDWDTAAAPLVYDVNGGKYMSVATKGGWLYVYDRV